MAGRAALTFLLRRIVPAFAVGALLVASLKLAEDASGDSARFASHYPWVLGAAGIALVVLAVAIGCACGACAATSPTARPARASIAAC
jgi:hypothetical protein